MNILLADDHAVLRKGLMEILADEFTGAVFGEASSTSETLDCMARQKWDVIVLDIFMPGRTGLDALQEVRKLCPHVPVIVLSSAPEEQMAVRVLKLGANGYLNKQAAPEDLVKAIRKVLSGGKYISETMAERLAEEIGHSNQPLHEKLSEREYEVMQRIIAGNSIKEISHEMALSPKTVSTYRTRILEKLHVQNNVELIRYAIENGLM